MNKRDYYEILGVEKTATQQEIKSSFRKLAKKYHPDVSKEANAEEKFKEAQEAYAILSDESKRSQYDQYGHQAFQGASGGAGGYDFSDFDFSDIFGDIFGGGFGFNFGGGGRSSNRPRKGNDILVRINLSFDEAVHGCTKEIKLNVSEKCSECNGKGGHKSKTCPDCHGSGSVTTHQRTMFGTFASKSTCSKCNGKGETYETECKKCHGHGQVTSNKTIEVKVPAGVDTGNQLRLAGKGEASSNGGQPGDAYLEFNVSNHKLYIRDENDIYLKVPISITEATLGVKKDIPTLTGIVTLTIPAGSNTNDKHRLKGKGISDVNTKRHGDMYVLINVITPEKLNKEQKKLLEQLNKTNLKDDSDFKNFDKFIKEVEKSK